MVRRLLPPPAADVDATTMYGNAGRSAPPGRPYVVVNMVASVDGATAVRGVTKALGSPTDRAVFLHLRDVADAILVGAATVRAERYGPARPSPEVQDRRRHAGQAPSPPIVAVSRQVAFDWDTPLFAGADPRPILLVPADADVTRTRRARQVADVIATGSGGVDLTDALRQLRARGTRVLLCEGGPSLNAQLLEAGLVDELCLTVAPVLTGGSHPAGIFAGPGAGSPRPLTVRHVLEADSFLYLRYLAAPPGG